jgi:protein SCO1/2
MNTFLRPLARCRCIVPYLLLAALVLVGRPASSRAEESSARRAVVPDVELLDQDGKKVHLYSDLVKDRVVAFSFIFTSCPTTCNTIGINLSHIRKELGPALGEKIAFISISIDPATDTPAKMKAWGNRFGAGPGWSLLTGKKEQVTRVLKQLEAFTANIQEHSPFLLVVNDARGTWQRVNALSTAPQKVAALLRAEASGKPPAPAGSVPVSSP